MKHTEGPWNFHESYDPWPGDIRTVPGETGFDYAVIQIAKGDVRIAQVEWDNAKNGGHPSVESLEEMRGNALIMLAAPELYKVCKRIASYPYIGLALHDQELLEAVIAKAEGEE